MLRELIDIALLEDFVDGVARASRLRVVAFDAASRLITASTAAGETGRNPSPPPAELAANPLRQALPEEGAQASLAFVEHGGMLYALAPIYLADAPIGFVAVSDPQVPPRDGATATGAGGPNSGGGGTMAQSGAPAQSAAGAPRAHSTAAVQDLPALREQRLGDVSHAVVTARWAARLLSAWCKREARMHSAAEELSLVGDIAELLTGEQDLQTILDLIVADTARVMRCRACSLRMYDAKTDELKTAAVYNLSPTYLNKGALLRGEHTIDDEALRGNIVYVENFATDPRVRYPQEAQREGIVSGLTAGMIYRGKPVGVIRVYADRKQRFRSVHRNLLRAVASQAATAIVHAQLVTERLRKAEMERQLKLAGQVQARMIRTPAPRHEHLDTARVFEPSSHVGGDFCDFLTLADGRLTAVVADVVGHGVPASLMMASVRGALRAVGEFCGDLGEILNRLNQHVYRETAAAEFVTMLLIGIDPAGRRLGYASAGHEPLLLLREGEVHKHADGGLVLGIDPSERYTENVIDLIAGDSLLLYTDGVIEAMNFEQAMFGRERLLESLRGHGALSPEQMLRNIVWDIRRFVGLAEQSDDLTLVGLRVR